MSKQDQLRFARARLTSRPISSSTGLVLELFNFRKFIYRRNFPGLRGLFQSVPGPRDLFSVQVLGWDGMG